MFGGRFSSCTGVLGIDFGARGVKLLQVREQGDRLHVVGAARVDTAWPPSHPLTPSAGANPGSPAAMPGQATTPAGDDHAVDAEALTARLQAAYAAGGFVGRRCVVSLPRTSV